MAVMSGCMHGGAPDPTRVCVHLHRDVKPGVRLWRWYTGEGLAFDLVCAECRARREAGEHVVVAVSGCRDCLRELLEDVADVVGSAGAPGIRVRESPPPALLRTPLPADLVDALDFVAVDGASTSRWLFLRKDGGLVDFDADSGARIDRMRVPIPEEVPREPWAGHVRAPKLHASRDGRFAAVVLDYGRRGVVVDLDRGAVPLALDGGDYHPETVPFSLAFVEHDGQPRLVHRTAWNRLDVSDPRTGALLSARDPGKEHALDYFHGRLHVSPDHARVLDDGWIWAPVGVPRVWSLQRWLRDEPFESEDGPSRQNLPYRHYYWDHGMCWLDAGRVAIGGIGDDDQHIVDGASIFAVGDAGVSLLHSFAGPAGELFGAGDRLYSSAAEGLSAWDVTDGARLWRVQGFSPSRQHRGVRELAGVAEGTLVRLRY